MKNQTAMAANRSAFPCNPSTVFPLHRFHVSYGRNCIPSIRKPPSPLHTVCCLGGQQQVDSREFGHEVHGDPHSKPEGKNQPAPALPQKPVAPPWLSWVFWSILYIAPLSNIKRGKPPRLLEKVVEVVEVVEDVVDTIEDVAEVVDDVADFIDKVSSDLGDNLPSDSMLKHVASRVEDAAEAVSDGAEKTIDFINKVQDLKEELERKVDDILDLTDDESQNLNEERAKEDARSLVDLAGDERQNLKEERAKEEARS